MSVNAAYQTNLLQLPLFWTGTGVIAPAGWPNMDFNDLAPGILSVAVLAGASTDPSKQMA